MKAILVLELDDEWLDINNFNIDELLADVTLYHDLSLKRQCDYRQRIYRCFSRLKPLPKKKREWVDAEDTIWNDGWNDCLEEIEK